MKEKKVNKEKPLRFLQLIEKPVPRPPTPLIEPPNFVKIQIEQIFFLFQIFQAFLSIFRMRKRKTWR
jgi:hypothetical protein